jgi:hypothetical protein
MGIAPNRGLDAQNGRQILRLPRVGGELRLRHGHTVAAGAGLNVREVDLPVRGKGRIKRDVEQAGIAATDDPRHARNLVANLAVARHGAHRAGLLGHEHRSVGEERQRPRVPQTVRDHLDAQRRLHRHGHCTSLAGERRILPLAQRLSGLERLADHGRTIGRPRACDPEAGTVFVLLGKGLRRESHEHHARRRGNAE